MKISRLPELDLARITVMPPDQQIRQLKQMKRGRPPYSYNPYRSQALDILNVNPGPLAPLPPTTVAQILKNIRARCGTEAEIRANIAVGQGLCNYASEHDLNGEYHDFMPFGLGIAGTVVYWLPAVIEVGGRPTVPFFNPRLSKSLTDSSRRFVLSVMHQRIREADIDFANVRLAVYHFDEPVAGVRKPRPYFDDGIELFGFKTLCAMVQETYELWREVLEGRRDEGDEVDWGPLSKKAHP